MTGDESKWSTAQQRERQYYATRAAEHDGDDEVYALSHAPFWEGILSRLPEVEPVDEGVYVDVGCGPNPIVTFIGRGRRIGVDPLMPFYEEHFGLPPDVETHEGTIEELAPIGDGEADVIFSMNNLDHIEDLPRAVATLRRKLADDGRLVVSVNIVGNPLTARVARRLDVYRVVDPTHTYHFHSPREVADHLASHFELVRHEDVEELASEMAERKKQVDEQTRSVRGIVRTALKFVKNDVILRERHHLLIFRPRSAS